MIWHGPFRVRDVLENCFDDHYKPPECKSVYVVSLRPWESEPTPACQPLYVGSNTGKSERFRTRVGDLIADAFGLYCCDTGHSCGGRKLHEFCRDAKLNPMRLFLGWLSSCACHRCAERAIWERLRPRLNKNRPARCKTHPVLAKLR